jgi:hypothetical protein
VVAVHVEIRVVVVLLHEVHVVKQVAIAVLGLNIHILGINTYYDNAVVLRRLDQVLVVNRLMDHLRHLLALRQNVAPPEILCLAVRIPPFL